METPQLTEWDKQERAALLAGEAPEWRAMRLEAEDPETSTERLAELDRAVEDVLGVYANLTDEEYEDVDADRAIAPLSLLAEAIVAHANVAPPLAFWMLPNFRFYCAKRLCRRVSRTG